MDPATHEYSAEDELPGSVYVGLENRISPPRRARKSEICSAKIVGYAVDPPQRRLASLSTCLAEDEPVRKPSVCSPSRVYDPRLSAHHAVTSRTPKMDSATDELPGIVYGSRK